ncbi:MAG: hypothetical protein QY318_02070 [Candidatus Dojkabacteria bacterium]|nr:MAG: hypothetical protein QY318_02070 [Candidatus Dojkabacteria bacterium]
MVKLWKAIRRVSPILKEYMNGEISDKALIERLDLFFVKFSEKSELEM